MKALTTLVLLGILTPLCVNISFAQVNYSQFNYPDTMGGSFGPTGVRGAEGRDVYVTGAVHPTPPPTPTPACFVDSHGLLYKGKLNGNGSWTVLDYPSSSGTTVTGTVLYGPDTLPPSDVRLVGSYTICEESGTRNHGLLYEGPPDGSGTWQTIDFPISAATPSPSPGEQVLNTIAHSNMGGLVVGNFDTNLATGRAFVYDIDTNSWVELVKPMAASITAYGIWYNGGTSYTIAGGYADVNFPGIDQHGYLVNWDSTTQTPSDWTNYDFDNGHIRVAVSHFDGITTDNRGGFYLTGDWVSTIPPDSGAFFAHVRRQSRRAFGDARWTEIAYPSSPGLMVDTTSGNTVFEDNVLGIYTANGDPTFNGYVATIRDRR
jgi:hypothetical protein